LNARAPELVQRYFRAKREQLLAMSSLAVCQHTGLVGGHREEFQRVYLREVVPRRFEVGRGMVYGLNHRSHEADIVLWDADNYPSLPMQDHSFYFAESVRAVVEAKTRWSSKEFQDVLMKSRAVRNIVPTPSPDNLGQAIAMLQLEVSALRVGAEHDGMIWAPHHIGTAAVFLTGGAEGLRDESAAPSDILQEADDSWPDLMLFLEAGLVAIKSYGDEKEGPSISLYDCGEDCLLLFTRQLLDVLADRSVGLEGRFYFDHYMIEAQNERIWSAPFSLQRMQPGRVPLWRDGPRQYPSASEPPA
jgi:hypothetical protein